jgi:DHA1 family inner membrane transport protein
MPRLLWLLSFVNLIIGSGAFVIAGILTPMSNDLGISVAAAGQAMTAYALSCALLAPLLLLATGGWQRKQALVVAIGLFTLGNLMCALSAGVAMLMAGRVVMGLGAVFTPIAAGIAVAAVEPARRGKALAVTFLGISLSYVIGVPLGTWLGLAYAWQSPIWLFTVLSLVAWVSIMVWVPRDMRAPGASFAGLPSLLARRDVLSVLLLTLLYFIAIFAVFSYIGPVLQALTPMSREQQSLTLALFGLSGVAGTLIGGVANDRFGARRTLMLQLTVLGATMALLPFTRGSWPALVATLIVWGTAGFGMMVPQQSRLVMLASAQAPMLFSLNTSMLYLGTALGAIVGGASAARLGFAHLAWAGVPFVAIGLVILASGHNFGATVTADRKENAA